MTEIKAIETRYAGCRFRSRLEARWAVFFDSLDIQWEYEPEGFETPDGWYLPDFRLNYPDGGLWVEIKGPNPTHRDMARARHLKLMVLLIGDIPRTCEDFEWWGHIKECTEEHGDTLRKVGPEECVPGWVRFSYAEHLLFGDVLATNQALTAARSARFEHGESGAPR